MNLRSLSQLVYIRIIKTLGLFCCYHLTSNNMQFRNYVNFFKMMICQLLCLLDSKMILVDAFNFM